MNDLSSILLDKHSHYEIEEYVKSGQALTFDSGKEQRIVGGSIPSFEISLTYSNISLAKFEFLKKAYESNYANTFKCLFNNDIDKRSQLMTNEAEVYIFKDFEFSAIAGKLNVLSGKITLLSSVFFNFTEYQSLFTESSTYTPTASTNQDFMSVLDDAQPYQVIYKYFNQSIASNIGVSGRHIKDKGLKKAWGLSWVLGESDFLKLLLFYRKKSGLMGEFGMPLFGTNAGFALPYVEESYLENQDDYILFDGSLDGATNARFSQDSFQYSKRIDGLYQCTADFMEVN